MQLVIDLTNQPQAYGKRIIAMIEAFYGIDRHGTGERIQPPSLAEFEASRNATAAVSDRTQQAVFGAFNGSNDTEAVIPLAQPAATAPSTVVVEPNQIAPGVPQVTSILTPAQPAPAVPTVPAATAPLVPAAPTTHASGVAIDKAGLPWDARIHSSSKAINADGTWRKRKGLNDEGLVKRIESELLAAMAVPAAPVATIPPQTEGGWTAPEVAPLPAVPVQTEPAVKFNNDMQLLGISTIPPAIPAPAEMPAIPFENVRVSAHGNDYVVQMNAPAAIPTAPPTTLAELMPRITGAMMTGALPGTALLDVVKAPPFGIPDLPTLAHRPDLIPQVWSVLQQTYPGVLV